MSRFNFSNGRAPALAAMFAVGAVLGAGCLAARPELPKPECAVNSECTGGKICGPGGVCIAECKENSDCASPKTCQEGVCVAAQGRCASSADCSATQVCSLGNCVGQCKSAAECGNGQICANGSCLLVSSNCTGDNDCPSGQKCSEGRCSLGCTMDQECAPNMCLDGVCKPAVRAKCFSQSDCNANDAGICGPQGDCVKTCMATSECAASGEACSGGGCVHVGSDVGSVSGRVQVTGATSPAGFGVRVQGLSPGTARTVVAADGVFEMHGIPQGNYTLTVDPPSSALVENFTSVAAPIRLGMTTDAGVLELFAAGIVEGTVILPGRATNAGVQVTALLGGMARPNPPSTDADGGYSMKLRAGTYDLKLTRAGFLDETISGVMVKFGETTTVPTKQMTPLATGDTYAFTSVPPLGPHYSNHSFNYTAYAAGGGVLTEKYELVTSPSGMTIDATTGAVSWPTPNSGTYFIVIAAHGDDGSTLYQMFSVTFLVPVISVATGSYAQLASTSAGMWASGTNDLRFIDNDGGVWPKTDVPKISGTGATIARVNGTGITSATWRGGKTTAVRGASGPLVATWEGGTVSAVTGLDKRTIASSTLLGGTVTASAAVNQNTITAVTYANGPITTITDPRVHPTGMRTSTGVVTAVGATTLTDSTAAFTTNAFVGSCVIDINNNDETRLPIAANDATSLTLTTSGADLSSLWSAGERYFIGRCSDGLITITIEDTTATFPSLSGRYAELYSPTQYIGQFSILSSPAPTTTTFAFSAYASSWPVLQTALNGGYYALGFSNGVDVTMTDTTANFAANLSSTNRFATDDFSNSSTIISNTATSITFRLGVGRLHESRVGRRWVLLDTSSQIPVTLTLSSAVSGTPQYVWIDPIGTTRFIQGSTANSVSFRAPTSDYPFTGWVNGLTAFTNGSSPGYRITTTAVPAGQYENRDFLLIPTTGGYTDEAPIVSQTATQVVLEEGYRSGTNIIAQTNARYVGARWAPGDSSGPDFRIVLSGSPNLVPDSLVGRRVVTSANANYDAFIIANDGTSITVAVDNDAFAAFQTLKANDEIWVGEPPVVNAAPIRVRITSTGSTWTVDQWKGYSLADQNGNTVGTVLANAASTVDVALSVSSSFSTSNPLSNFAIGSNFGFFKNHPEGVSCSSRLWMKSNVKLTGATLVASRYNQLRLNGSVTSTIYPVQSNTATDATVYVCSSGASSFFSALGRVAALGTSGKFELNLDVTAPTYSGSVVGQYVFFLGSTTVLTPYPVTSNTASLITIETALSNWATNGSTDFARVMAGGDFVLTNASREARIDLNVSPNVTAGVLVGSTVRVTGPNVSTTRFLVTANTANAVTIDGVPGGTINLFSPTSTSRPQYLGFSQGTVIRVTDPTKAFTPGALVGRSLVVKNLTLEIVSNTATEIVAWYPSHDGYNTFAGATTYDVQQDSLTPQIGVTAAGDALVGLNGSGGRARGVFTTGPAGAPSPVLQSGMQVLTVSEVAPTLSTLTNSVVLQSSGPTSLFTEPTWAWAPGALVGQYARVRGNSPSDERLHLILANTATTITVAGNVSVTTQAGKPFVVMPATLNVTGTTLTAGALKGKLVRLNGYDYVIRDNTASQLKVWIPESMASGSQTPSALIEANGTAVVFNGLSSDRIVSVAADGSGFWAATVNAVFNYDGTTWRRFGFEETATVKRTGTVTSLSSSTLVDASATFTPDEHDGSWVVFDGRRSQIYANTATTLYFDGTTNTHAPLPGASYTVLADDGISDIQDIAVAGGTLWVGTDRGLWRRTSANVWTHFTRASTESMAGAGDGLKYDDVWSVQAFGSDVYVAYAGYYGFGRLSGSTWTSFSIASTESAPGLRDGLLDDYVNDFWRDSMGNVWAISSSGVSRIATSAPWVQYSSYYYSTTGYHVTPSGVSYVSTNGGVFRLVP